VLIKQHPSISILHSSSSYSKETEICRLFHFGFVKHTTGGYTLNCWTE